MILYYFCLVLYLLFLVIVGCWAVFLSVFFGTEMAVMDAVVGGEDVFDGGVASVVGKSISVLVGVLE